MGNNDKQTGKLYLLEIILQRFQNVRESSQHQNLTTQMPWIQNEMRHADYPWSSMRINLVSIAVI